MKQKQPQNGSLLYYYFISFSEDKKVDWHGQVIGIMGDYFIVDTFSWLTGDYWDTKVVAICQCLSWSFYKELNSWQEAVRRKCEIVKRECK